MANTSQTLILETTDALHLDGHTTKAPVLERFQSLLSGLKSGAKRGVSAQLFANGDPLLPAVAHIKLATCAADTVIEINGAPFTAIAGTVVTGNDEFDIDGTDAADAIDLARAINASSHAAISGIVKAVNPTKDILTPSTAIAGDKFTVTLADGTVHVFIGAAAAATVGALTFDTRTSNAACATSITAQVNGYAPFTNKLAAIDGTTVVTFRSLDGNSFTLAGTAVTLADSGGAVVTLSALQKGALANGLTVKCLGVLAKGTVTVTASGVDADDTVTINAVDLTAKQQRATGTLTAATAIAGTTFVLRGFTFTGAAGAVTLGAQTFSIDTGNTETATSIAAQINGFSPFSGVLTATSSTDTVTIRAVDAGTAGNSIGLVGTETVLEASAATLEGGIAVLNNEFDLSPGSTSTQVATDLARCINASTSTGINQHVRADSDGAVCTIWAKYPGTFGNSITLASSDAQLAVSAARLAGGTTVTAEGTQASATLTLATVLNGETCAVNGVTLTAHTDTAANDQFPISGDDSADAAALCVAINNSTTAALAEVIATSSSAVVTVKARKGGLSGNVITLSSAQATIVASAARLASGALPTTVIITNNDSLSRTNGCQRMAGGTGGAVSPTNITL